MNIQILSQVEKIEKNHDRSLDYLIQSFTCKDKYDKQIYRIKHMEWHDKFLQEVSKLKKLL